ncbi:MAG TPA: methylated-DNA--[protein]-cysteine S-methyltransferase [Rhizomicrobium sp.]|jgi:methylated-DNA-[protein]-cysteine S-methyltransferase|nr:methylated-DNA--[protein]-cysteine S-methyltransferase [Rhizomicrobium sp.]
MKTEKRYWAPIESRFGKFAAWVDGEGRLLRFNLRAKDAAHVDPFAEKNEKALARVQKQIAQYDAGKRQDFEFELLAEGPDFHKQVWDELIKIPFGTTTSYGALAKKLGYPNSARAVGVANGSNPIGLIVPCHRVIGSDGSLTGYGGGLPLKRALLEHEARVAGVPLDLFAR